MKQPESTALPVLLLAVLGVFTAQQTLAPVLAPLSRTLGLTEVQLGVVMTTAAASYALSSLFWGRLVDRWGVRPVLLTGLALATAALLGFAGVSQVAIRDGWDPTLILGALLATRSLVFGAAMGAVPVAAMAYVGRTTDTEVARTRGLGLIGAVQGASVALGPALGAAAGFAGLLGPVWVAPGLALLGLVGVALALPAGAHAGRQPAGQRQAALRLWDRRLRPALAAVFGAYLALGLVLIVLGFTIQDRFGLSAAATVRATGAAGFAAGVMLIVAQGVLVPRLRWTAGRLLRVGLPVAVASLVGFAVAPGLLVVVLSLAALGLGLGLAMPGLTATPTLLVAREEQGAVAGLVTATTGLTFVVGPLLGTVLYSVQPQFPVALAAVACAAAAALAFVHPVFRADTGAVEPVVPGPPVVPTAPPPSPGEPR